jgi:hypothetical protein
MFGIPIERTTDIYCDNQGVVTNTTKPESTLKKKHRFIAYHRVREGVKAGTICFAKEGHKLNIV